jgi:uncharacterized membrane protein
MKKIFLTGLACLLPFTVTIMITLWVLNILTKPFMGIVSPLFAVLPISEGLTLKLSQLLVLALLFMFILFLGMVGRWFFFEKLLKLGDRLLNRIPLFNKIYKTTKDAVRGLFAHDSTSFQQVVMIPFPSPDSFVLGLVAMDAPETCSEATQEALVSIFLPTAPNPSNGFIIMRPKSQLIYLQMSSSEVLKYVVSCGVAAPGRKTS